MPSVELQDKGFETFGSLAFAVSTTPQQITDSVLEAWLIKVTSRDLSPYQVSCVRRLVVESHALALNDLQRKVDQPSDLQLAARKLPVAERQSRQTEQEQRLQGLIFSPEVIPSHALVDTCVNMVEQGVLSWIKPEDCTSRAEEIQSLKRGPKVSLDAAGNLKISPKTTNSTCTISSELDLRNAFQRRSLAMDQAKLCSFTEIERWIQHLFLSHERAQPSGFASVTLQQIIECDKQMFVRASSALVGSLQAEPGVAVTPLDKELQTLRTSPELMPYLMPMPVKSAPKAGAPSVLCIQQRHLWISRLGAPLSKRLSSLLQTGMPQAQAIPSMQSLQRVTTNVKRRHGRSNHPSLAFRSFTSAAVCSRNLLWESILVQKSDRCRFFRSCCGPYFTRPPGAGYPLGFDTGPTSEYLN